MRAVVWFGERERKREYVDWVHVQIFAKVYGSVGIGSAWLTFFFGQKITILVTI